MKRREHARLGHKLKAAWREAEVFGKARQLRESPPKRYTLLCRQGIEAIRPPVHYAQSIVYWNEHYHPQGIAGTYTILDFLVWSQGVLLAVLIKNPASLRKPNEKQRWQSKLDELEARGVPYLVLPISFTSQEYAGMILMKLRLLKRRTK